MVPLSKNNIGLTSNQGEGHFDQIVRLFQEVEPIGFDIGVPACLIEVGFYHLEERCTVVGSDGVPARVQQKRLSPIKYRADMLHWDN